MYVLLGMNEFGCELRKIRENSQLSRKQVEEATGVTSETLRKIEKGIVTPRLETLQILSTIYHTDLVEILLTLNRQNSIYELDNRIDTIILGSNLDEILQETFELRADIETTFREVKDDIEMHQFNVLIENIQKTYSTDSKILGNALEAFTNAIRKRHSDYSITKYDSYIYSNLELRLIMISSIILAQLKDYELSTRLIRFAIEQLNISEYSSMSTRKLYIKLLSNLSCNYHVMNLNNDALEISNIGIKFCNDNHFFYLLEIFYYRKAIALHLTRKPGVLEYLQHVKSLMQIQGKKELLKSYIKMTKDKYGIEF